VIRESALGAGVAALQSDVTLLPEHGRADRRTSRWLVK